MTNAPGNSGEVERFEPIGQLTDRQVEELAIVGLTAQFPATMDHLNDSLVAAAMHGSFGGYRFSLTPDADRPSVSVSAERAFPWDVTVDADRLHRASFIVKTKPEFARHELNGAKVINWVDFGDLLRFRETHPQGDQLKLSSAKPKLTLPLINLEDVEALEATGIEKTATNDLKLFFIADKGVSLHMPIEYSAHAGREDVRSFGVGDIDARGNTSDIERVIEAYADLIKSHTEPLTE